MGLMVECPHTFSIVLHIRNSIKQRLKKVEYTKNRIYKISVGFYMGPI